MIVEFWGTEFTKRKNSTKIPTTEGVKREVAIKGNFGFENQFQSTKCSVMAPSFFITGAVGYGYCKAWDNYYWITNISFDIDGAEYINCEIDVLASFREQIGKTSAFVEYSSSNYDVDVIDSRVAVRTLDTVGVDNAVSIFSGTHGVGCYIVTASGIDQGMWSVAMDTSNFKLLINDLLTADGSDLDNLQLQFGDAIGSISSIRWVPIPYNHFSDGGFYECWIGSYHGNSGGYLLSDNGTITDSATLTINRSYGDFRRCGKFSSYDLSLPFIGTVQIPADSLRVNNGYASALNINMVGNVITGQLVYTVSIPEAYTRVIATYNGTFGISLPISSEQKDSTNAVKGLLLGLTGAAGMIASAYTASPTGFVMSAGTLLKGATENTFAEAQTLTSMVGSFGGNNGNYLLHDYILISKEVKCRTEPSELRTLYGRPCMKVLAINTLSGYVQTLGFSIEIAALDDIRTRINQLMDSGVYLE